MSKKKKPYWEDRQEKKYLAGEKKVNDYYRDLKKSFEQSRREIQSKINDFYWRYAEENQLSFASAQIKLNQMEIGELQDFIDLAKANMGKYNQELNNMSIRARITRYEALEKQIDAILQELYGVKYQHKGEELLKEVYSDAYYRTWFNIDQYHGFHQEFAQIGAKIVEELIRYPFNGADFSTRLWKQKDHMLQKMNESITTMLIQGRNPKTLVKEFSKTFGTKEYEAYRLLHTEGSFIMGQGTLAGYKEDGVKKYRILATLDVKTSDKCRGMDGKEFNVEDAVVGVNYWPFHPNCRTTDVPVYEDDDLSEEKRVARDPVTGKTYDVPADMTYENWYKKHIENNPKALLEEKKWKNRQGDKKQYEEYKEKLGTKYLPKSFDEFQNVKYATGNEYGILKAQARGMIYYNRAIANEPAITEHIIKVAGDTGMDVTGIENRIKSKDSYLRKIRKRYRPGGNEYVVNDILRYTYSSNPIEMTEKTLKSIDAHKQLGYNTIRVKNYWLDDSDSYNGINTIIKDQNGQKFELQYHTHESFKLKEGKLHKIYEKQRMISDRSSKEYLDLDDEMFELSKTLTVPNGVERIKSYGED